MERASISPIVTSVTTFWRLASDLETREREKVESDAHVGGGVDDVRAGRRRNSDDEKERICTYA